MRVTFYKNIKTMSGLCKQGNMVFSSVKNDSICIARNYVKPRLTEYNELAAEKMRAAVVIWKILPVGFIQDLKTYAYAYNSQILGPKKLPLTAYNIFIMALLKNNTPIQSISILVSIIGNTVDAWINAGFLKRVNIATSLNSPIN